MQQQERARVELHENGAMKSLVLLAQTDYRTDPRLPRINRFLTPAKPLVYLLPVGDALKHFWNKAYK